MRRASLSEFKQWMAENSNLAEFFNISKEENEAEAEDDSVVGSRVRPKVPRKKLTERVATDGDIDDVVDDFINNGGTIVAVEQNLYHVETEESAFTIPRFCVKMKKTS